MLRALLMVRLFAPHPVRSRIASFEFPCLGQSYANRLRVAGASRVLP
jgi:hypothetical protein